MQRCANHTQLHIQISSEMTETAAKHLLKSVKTDSSPLYCSSGVFWNRSTLYAVLSDPDGPRLYFSFGLPRWRDSPSELAFPLIFQELDASCKSTSANQTLASTAAVVMTTWMVFHARAARASWAVSVKWTWTNVKAIHVRTVHYVSTGWTGKSYRQHTCDFIMF